MVLDLSVRLLVDEHWHGSAGSPAVVHLMSSAAPSSSADTCLALHGSGLPASSTT